MYNYNNYTYQVYMKKRLFLNKFILLPVTLTTGFMSIMSFTSCSSDYIYVSSIDYNSIHTNKNYNNAVFRNIEYWKILYGSKKFYNGNYIVIFGSSTFEDTNKFFTGQDNSFESLDKWYKNKEDNGYFDNSIFYAGIVNNGKIIKNFGIFNIIDYFNGKFYDNKNHEINVFLTGDTAIKDDKISPWTKWTKPAIDYTYYYNKKDFDDKKINFLWDKDSVSTSDYIRNDQSAKAFRAMATFGAKLYPKTQDENNKNKDTSRSMTFNTEDGNTDSRVLIFVNGKLKDLTYLPTSPNGWTDLIVTNFEDAEKDENSDKN